MGTTLGNQRFRRTAVLGIALITLSLLLGGCPQSSGDGDDDGTPPPVQYTLTFNTHGGSAVQPVTANAGTVVNKPADPTRPGYTFLDWFSAETGGTAYSWPHTLNTNVTIHAQWWDNSIPVNVPVSVTVWVSENDGAILASNDNVAISKSGSGGEPTSFTIAVTGSYAGVQWYLKGEPISGSPGTAQSLILDAADYTAGTYILGVTVTNNGVPYSTDIRFTVSN